MGQAPPIVPKAAGESKTPVVAPTTIAVVRPEYRMQTTVLETTGKVQFNEEALARVHAPVTGRVMEVLARPGDVVETGQPLLVIDSADLGSAKSDYAKAVADEERSVAALKLARELLEVKAIAQKEIREAENDYRKAVAERERAASRLRTLGIPDAQFGGIAGRADAATTVTVTAPRSGVIIEKNVALGQVVAFGQSDTPVNLFVIADLSTMWVLADVYEPDIPKIRLDQTAVVTPPCCPGQRYEGRVANISDAVDKDTRTLKVRIVVPNRGRALKGEMFVKVAIDTGGTRVLTLPLGAIHRDGGQTFVLVARGKDAYERRPVTLGAELDGTVEIREGLSPKDHVVSTGGILLKKTVQ
ncbi:MAG TPA: efflux RND transporter periplasmic adaptor subunit [Candidatus Methylomirabilis sp.]|nr:efflux RND transporter periplasmic adaptor subunit [Candidatus Methylomirabilis sp.]